MNTLPLTPLTFIIVCPLVFLAGFVDSIAGGGGIISLPAYLFAGLPVHNALATNKLSSFCGSTIATGRYLKNKCYEKVFILPTVIAALIGSATGARLALIAQDEILKKILLVILPIVAMVVIFRSKRQKIKPRHFTLKIQLIIAIIASLFIGMYDGFYGPGTGTFLMLVFTSILGFDERKAAGNTKCINWASNAAALATFITGDKVLWILGSVAALCSIAGNYCGSGLVIKDGGKYVRPVIVTVLVLLFVKVLSGK
ncbi:MAG: hypothetical protein BKP49_00365 [Treponema sp. CETP13]|nr:MAG: hypothetical protein BKP49_00365 [Treponema sp. CETP13]